MTHLRKTLLATLAGATLLGGCATGTYYDSYGYNYGPDPYGYGYDGPVYYGPAYVGPSIGLGLSYSDRDYRRREWRGDRDHDRDHDHDGRRDGRRDRDGWRDRDGDRGPRQEAPIGHGGPGGSNPRDGGSPG